MAFISLRQPLDHCGAVKTRFEAFGRAGKADHIKPRLLDAMVDRRI